VRLIKDIRYFEFDRIPAPGVGRSIAGSRYALPSGATAVGQRIALKLRELGVVIGSFDHLYLAFTPALSEHAIVDTGWSGEPWLRYVAAGLPSNFNQRTAAERLTMLATRTFAAVRLLQPASEIAIAATERLIHERGADLRIHLMRYSSRALEIELSYTIAASGAVPASQAWIAVTDRRTGHTREALLADLQFFEDVFFLASRVTVKDRVITVHPRRSARARLYTSRYDVPFVLAADDILGR
jgi:hypothetical protein